MPAQIWKGSLMHAHMFDIEAPSIPSAFQLQEVQSRLPQIHSNTPLSLRAAASMGFVQARVPGLHGPRLCCAGPCCWPPMCWLQYRRAQLQVRAEQLTHFLCTQKCVLVNITRLNRHLAGNSCIKAQKHLRHLPVHPFHC